MEHTSDQSAEARLRAVEEIVTWVVKDIQDTFHCSYDTDCLRKVVAAALAAATPAKPTKCRRCEELHDLLDECGAPEGSSENDHPMGASVRERIIMLAKRTAPAKPRNRERV